MRKCDRSIRRGAAVALLQRLEMEECGVSGTKLYAVFPELPSHVFHLVDLFSDIAGRLRLLLRYRSITDFPIPENSALLPMVSSGGSN